MKILFFSYLTGNLFVYYLLNDVQKEMNKSTRGEITIILMGFVIIAVIMIIFLRQPLRKKENKSIKNLSNEFKKSYFILKSKHIIISSTSFIFCGRKFFLCSYFLIYTTYIYICNSVTLNIQ